MSVPGPAAPSPDTTLDRLLRILSAFDAENPELTVSALARRTALPLPTAYRWVDRLVRSHVLDRDAEGRVRPGLWLWEIAARSVPTQPLTRAAMPFLLDVQAVLRENTQLAVLDDDGVLVLESLSGQGAVVNRGAVAGRLPAFTTSLGLVLLAYAPPGEAARFIARHREAAPADEVLRGLLAQVRRDGYAAIDGALDEEARGIAVPIRRGHGRAPAALGVVVPRDAPVTAGVPALLMTAARGIARSLDADSH